MTAIVGIDIGGTNIRFGLFDNHALKQELRRQADFSLICQSNPPEIALQKIVQTVADGVNALRLNYTNIQAVGIGFPGFIDPASNAILQSPNLPGLSNIAFANILEKHLNMPVVVENDALCAAVGEYQLAQMTDGHMVYIGLGTGVGGGLIYQHRPFTGQHGVSMEVGHLIVENAGRLCGCGNQGCLEQYASATGVSITYQQLTGTSLNAGQIAALASKQNVHAIEAYALAGQMLGKAVANIVKVVDVGNILIGGGMSKAWPLMEAAFYAALNLELIPVLKNKIQVHMSESSDQAGMLGAALIAGERSGL